MCSWMILATLAWKFFLTYSMLKSSPRILYVTKYIIWCEIETRLKFKASSLHHTLQFLFVFVETFVVVFYNSVCTHRFAHKIVRTSVCAQNCERICWNYFIYQLYSVNMLFVMSIFKFLRCLLYAVLHIILMLCIISSLCCLQSLFISAVITFYSVYQFYMFLRSEK